MSARKFSGPLANPIVVEDARLPLPDGGAPEYRAWFERQKKIEKVRCIIEAREKMNLLFEEFSVERTGDDERDFYRLTVAMALEFVPGFRFVSSQKKKKGKGRPKVWDDLQYLHLYADLTEVMKRKICSQSEACSILTKMEPYKLRWGKYRKRTLENRFIEATDVEHNSLILLYSQSEALKSLFDDPVSEIFGITNNPA